MKLLSLFLMVLALPCLAGAPAAPALAKKRARVHELTQQAIAAYKAGQFQRAIDLAEKIREVRIDGETRYLDSARKIILAARKRETARFDKTLKDALVKYTRGEYAESLRLCEGVLRQDPSSEEARICANKARGHLERGLASPR